MIIDSAAYSGKCTCGRGHPMDTQLAVVESGCLSRLEGVTIAKVDERRNAIEKTMRYIPCDTLLLSVKSAAPIPKGEVFAVMGRIHAASVEAPVAIGDIVIDNICGTQIVAIKEIR